MKLDLKFYNSNAPLPGQVLDNDTVIHVSFDNENNRIGLNNTWFGDRSDKLPLVGGQMTGTIRFGTGVCDEASLVLNAKPIIADNANNGGIANDYRYLYRFNSGIELGNHHMYLRLLTDNSQGTSGQQNGLSGDVWHYVSSNNRIDGTISKYIMLDTRNSGISRDNSKPQGVHTLTIGYSTLDVFNATGGVSIEFPTGAPSGQMKLSIGEASTTADIYAKYAVSAGSAGSLTPNAFYVNTTSTGISGQTGVYQQDMTFVPGNTSANKIILGTGIIAKKVPAEGYDTIGATPKTFNIELSIDPSILARISALESRYDVTFTTNYE